MPHPVVETYAFSVDAQANALHNAGLQASKSGHYESAHGYYRDALEVLHDLACNPAVILQAARIVRDDGFNYVRQSIHQDSDVVLSQGQIALGASENSTAILISLGEQHPPISGYQFNRTQMRSLHSEHGATIAVTARAITVSQVIFETGDKLANPRYEEARKHLLLGNNGYYLVSNDVLEARAEWFGDNESGVRKSLSHATASLIWTKKHDPHNFNRAALTYADKRTRLWLGTYLSHPVFNSLRKRP